MGAIGLVMVGGAVAAAPASAAIISPPAGGHSILVFPVRDFESAAGYAPGQHATVEVLRNNVVIGRSFAVADSTGAIEVNHPAPTPADTQNCWGNTGFGVAPTASSVVPDIVAGDVVRVTTAPTVGYETTTQNLFISQPATNVGGNIVVRGTSFDPAGAPLPSGQIQQRLIANQLAFNLNGRRTLRAPGDTGATLEYPDAAGPGHWTATYAGLDQHDQDQAVASESRIIWLGRILLPISENTIFEFGQIPGPTAPCIGTFSPSAVTSTTPSAITASNPAAGSPLTVSGVVGAGLAVSAAIQGGGPHPATITGSTWTALIPAAEFPADGQVTITATFSGAGAPPASSIVITKDTVAPGAPQATPGAGTYATSQSVTLSAEAGATIHYTNDGSTPSASSTVASGQIAVTSTQTLKAIAIDAVGNPGAVGTFAYTITQPTPPPPPAGGGAGAPAGSTTVVTQTILGPTGVTQTPAVEAINAAATRPALALKSLGLAPRIKQNKAQKQGLRLVMQLPDGTGVVKVSVYRKTSKGLRFVSSVSRTTSAPGQYRVSMNAPALRRLLRRGNYQVQVTPGYSKSELGTTSKASFRVI